MTNNSPTGHDRPTLEAIYGKLWDEAELLNEFRVTAIIPPQIIVVRRSDGQVGSMTFQNDPRFYFDFIPTGRDAGQP